MNETDDYIGYIAEFCGIHIDDVGELIANMPIELTDDLFDAVAHKNEGRILALVANARDEIVSEAYYPGVGETVLVDGEEAVVKHPRAPRDTVGVMIDGNLRMVKRGSVKPVMEGVFGVSVMPDLSRMQELAGILSTTSMGSAPVPAPEGSASKPFRIDVQPEPLPDVLKHFDDIESSLPALRLRDAKAVRARLNALIGKLNEGKRRKRP